MTISDTVTAALIGSFTHTDRTIRGDFAGKPDPPHEPQSGWITIERRDDPDAYGRAYFGQSTGQIWLNNTQAAAWRPPRT